MQANGPHSRSTARCWPERCLTGALRLILEWAQLHEDELLTNWTLARDHKPLLPIDPLG